MKQYYVYNMTNVTNTVLYTGITSDLVRRIWEHKNKVVLGFTSKYRVNKLVYYEVTEESNEAIKREKQIKNLVRRKKVDLINGFNASWRDLYDSII